MASVLYLTDTRYGQRAWQHPSARHRCYHYADALLSQGFNAAVVPMERVSPALLKEFDHIVFHRPVWNKRFSHALECCHAAGLKLHADYDDLVFHPNFAKYSPQHISGGKDVDKVRRQFENTHRAALSFDSFLVSTAYLADKAAELFPDAVITVLPNSLPGTFSAYRNYGRSGDRSNKITIGYFPGSRGHSEDMKSVVPVLNGILNKDVRMLIVGRMNKQDFASLKHVTHVPFADYADYLNLLSKVDLSIAPLLDNEFNQSKSAVKLIESVAVGTPIVASENRDMSDHDNELSHLVSNDSQWQESLCSLLDKSAPGHSSVRYDDSVVKELQKRFSVSSRLPALQEHLQCAV